MSMTIDSNSRITGLSSGLETDSMVEGLLMSYQTKLDRQAQKTTELEWKADAYREINTLIKNFRSKYLSVLSDTNMLSKNAYSEFEVNMLTTTSAASISVSSSAFAGTYSIDNITQLASAAKASSTGVFTGDSYSSDTPLETLELANAFEFDASDEISFSINGESFTFTKDTSVSGMMKQINTSNAGVTMRYSSLTKGFSLTSNETGSEKSVEIVNIAGNAFSAVDSALGISEGTYTGQDAICTIEGTAVTQSTNTFYFDGITYTLNDTSATAIQFSVSQDYQSSVDSVKDFVDSYNELVTTLQDKIEEKIYYDYDPLTDAQKEDMTEEEIEKWEEKAKSGVLHNDSYASSLLTKLRSAFYSTVEGTDMSLSDVGLNTGNYFEGAEIKVDEKALLKAFQDDPENVSSLFVQKSDTDAFSEEGLMVRISDALLNYTSQSTDIALESLEARISSSESEEDSLEDIMKAKEESLWARFTTMEAALAELNSMSSWLSTLFTY